MNAQDEMKEVMIDRPPRIQPELPQRVKEIPKPPETREEGAGQWLRLGLPLLTIMGYVLISTLGGGGGRSPLFLIPMGMSVVASVAFSIYSYREERLKREALVAGYEGRLGELSKEMAGDHDQQRRFYLHNYPDSHGLFLLVKESWDEGVEPVDRLRSRSRVWERRVGDDDFGVLRLGLGVLPSTVVYELKDGGDFEDRQMRAAMRLAETSRFVDEIPVVVALRPKAETEGEEKKEDRSIQAPMVTTLGIAGGRDEVYGYIRGLLAHYAVFHAPGEAKLYVVGQQAEPWRWLEGLPHSQADEQQVYRFFVAETEKENEEEGSGLERFLEGLRQTLAQRRIRLQDQERTDGENVTLPQLLVVVDLLDVVASDDPLYGIEADGALSILLHEGGMLGGAVIFLVPNRGQVPSGCGAVIEVEETTLERSEGERFGTAELYFRYAETGLNSRRYVGLAEAINNTEALARLVARLARMKIKQGVGGGLTKGVPYLGLMGCRRLEELVGLAEGWWGEAAVPSKAGWLKATLGLMAGHKLRTLRFSANKDGVHGMVAGGTGSGKSEMLISMLIDMAVHYEPTMLNFVLVDYKGGGAFDAFRRLPHCVDMISNLDRDGVVRMFTAIQSEMKRRQRLNTETQTKDIVEYRQKGYHVSQWPDGRAAQPYPFLFIIIDEFAEMMADQAEFKGGVGEYYAGGAGTGGFADFGVTTADRRDRSDAL